MTSNYWVKDDTRQEIITKTLIPNKGDFKFYGTYFNLMDKKGLSLYLDNKSEFERNKLFTKNDFQYIALEINGLSEFLILPNEKLPEYLDRIVYKIDNCKTEKDILNLLIEEM